MAAQAQVDVGGILRPQGSPDLSTALQPYRRALGERAAAHLLRRAGFGGTPDEVAAMQRCALDDAVASLLALPSTELDCAAARTRRSRQPISMATDPLQRTMLRQEMTPQRKIECVNGASAILALQLWWLNRMLTTPAPLQEKMTLYFHGHFTSRATPLFPWITYNQNALFRQYALGNLRELTREVSKDPAMLIYLNGAQNVAAHPNENYARELMELFTLGVDNYTENDVRESARAWTGWRVDRRTDTVTFDASLHDVGEKTFLGRTGNFNGDDIVDIIFDQPQCARFFAASLLNWFVYNDPEPELVDRVAALLRRHDFELAPRRRHDSAQQRLLQPARVSRARQEPGRVRRRHVQGARACRRSTRARLPALQQMGQKLFYPPSVAGWPGGENWLTSGTMIARQNFLTRMLGLADAGGLVVAARLAGGIDQRGPNARRHDLARRRRARFARELEGYLSGTGSAALASLSAENYDQRVSGAVYLAMATPAYQLS